MAPGDTARLYHRLSSYGGAPDEEWPTPIDHPLVRQDFAPNHLPTFPPHSKVYPASGFRTIAPSLPARRALRPT